jgi:hypothetical protein
VPRSVPSAHRRGDRTTLPVGPQREARGRAHHGSGDRQPQAKGAKRAGGGRARAGLHGGSKGKAKGAAPSSVATSFAHSDSRGTARAGNRRFWRLSALRAHTKAPYKTDLLWKTPRALKRPGRARTGAGGPQELERRGPCTRLVGGRLGGGGGVGRAEGLHGRARLRDRPLTEGRKSGRRARPGQGGG